MSLRNENVLIINVKMRNEGLNKKLENLKPSMTIIYNVALKLNEHHSKSKRTKFFLIFPFGKQLCIQFMMNINKV